MTDRIRWGILGTGNIAHQMAQALVLLPEAELAAVASRRPETATAFGERYGIARRYATYDAMYADKDLDVIYIATPHAQHMENTIRSLEGGKAVLCEKPLTINRAQAEKVVKMARETGNFLMEAMWTRYLPTLVQTRKWLAEGAIGRPRMVYADFGFSDPFDPESRLYDPAFGGGALLDVGVYAVSFAAMVFQSAPNRIAGLAEMAPSAVDAVNAAVLGYPCGGLAVVSSAVRLETPQEARIQGDLGSIHLPAPFWRGDKAILKVDGKEDVVLDLPYLGNGYTCEAQEVMDCIRAGRRESTVMTLDESVAVMDTLDRMRAQWNLRYPMD